MSLLMCYVCELQRMVYFPLIPQLQALFRSPNLSKLMVWHKHNKSPEGILKGPQDGAAWAHVNDIYPEFGDDPRNVRLAISMDGVNPFGQLRSNHSTWPITIVLYNLPPWLAIKSAHILLSTIVPGMYMYWHILYLFCIHYISHSGEHQNDLFRNCLRCDKHGLQM